MKNFEKFIGNCPKCGNRIEHSYSTESYEVSFFNRHIKKEILKKKEDYFVATCSRCRTEVVIAYPFRVVDPKRKYDIFLLPNGYPNEKAILNTIRSNDIESGYQTRLVSNGAELAEKIQIFDAGMDDRTVEMCKIFVWGDLCEQDPKYRDYDLKSCDYLQNPKDWSAYSGAHLLCYGYDVNGKRDAEIAVLEESYYQNIAQHLELDFGAHPLGPFEEINRNWAYRIINYRKKRLGL